MKEQKDVSAKLSAKLSTEKTIPTELRNAAMNAMQVSKRSSWEANQSTRQSQANASMAKQYKSELKAALQKVKFLENTVGELQDKLDESNKQLQSAQAKVPVTVIKKEQVGSKGAPKWPVYIWELLMEQLVYRTPSSSINHNIISFVAKLAPDIEIKELPSLWTIWRARTVLLIVVQTLAAYRLAKADKWGQLFTNETKRRQNSFQNLIISIEDDELFR